MNALAKLQLVRQLRDLVRAIQAAEGVQVEEAYLDASLTVQAQVKALLGVS